MTASRCPHCGGAMTRDEEGDAKCLICGRLAAISAERRASLEAEERWRREHPRRPSRARVSL